MTKAAFRLVATKSDEKTIRAEYRTFKQLSKAHHALAKKGWTVSLPV